MGRRKIISDEELVRAGNDLAGKFASEYGWNYPEGYRFYISPNSRAKSFWRLACIAFDVLQDTDLQNAADQAEPLNIKVACRSGAD